MSYAELGMSKESKNKLFEFVNTLKITKAVNPSVYHITVLFSDKEKTTISLKDSFIGPITAYATKYSVFMNSDNKACLVLNMNCPLAHTMNAIYQENGAKDKFTPYTCHMTIAYPYEGDVENIDTLPLPTFEMEYDTLTEKDYDEDYRPPTVT